MDSENQKLDKNTSNKKSKLLNLNEIMLLIAIILFIVSNYLIKENSISNALGWISYGIVSLLVFMNLLFSGVSINSFNSELIIFLLLIGLNIFGFFNESILLGIIFLLTEILVNRYILKINSIAKEFSINFKTFLRNWRKPRKKYFIVLISFVIITILISKLVFNLDVADIFYRTALVVIILSTFMLETGFPNIEFTTMIKLAKDKIYLSDTKNIYDIKDSQVGIFDKSGVLTTGKYKLLKIAVYEDYTEEEIIEILAYGLFFKNNAFSELFLKEYGKQILIEYIDSFNSLEDEGVSFSLAEEDYVVGNSSTVNKFGIRPFETENQCITLYVLKNNVLIGSVEVNEEMAEDVFNKMERILNSGINKAIMFSSESESYSRRIASYVGIEDVYSNLKSADKKRILNNYNSSDESNYFYVFSREVQNEVLEETKLSINVGDKMSTNENVDILIPNGQIDKIEDLKRLSSHMVKMILVLKVSIAIIKLIMIVFALFGVVNILEVSITNAIMTIIFLLIGYRILQYEYI